MATKRQIADLNASVTLYAKQYIDELTRVGRLTKTTTAGMGRNMTAAAKSTQLLNAAQVTGGRAGRQYGMVTQQAGYQVQDFAVQVASGQNALVAFGQQGSQMLGVFGPAGAIAGAALGVGVLVTQLLRVKDAGKDAKEEIRELGEIIKSIQDRGKAFAFDRASTTGKQGILSVDTQDLLAQQADIARQQMALNAEQERIQSLAQKRIDQGNFALAGAGNARSQEIIAELDELRRKAAELTDQLQILGEKTFGVDETAAREARSRVKGMMKELNDYAEQQNQNAEAIRQAQEQRAASYKKEGEALMRSVMTPQEEYAEAVSDLDRRLKHRNITQEAYNRLLAEAAERLDRAAVSSRKLRSETLSISEIASAGGSSANASKARRALDIRERAKEAEARGNFSFADKLYAQAQSVEGRIKRRDRTFDAETGAPAGISTVSTGAPSAPAGETTAREISVRSTALDEIKRILEGLENSVAVA